MTKEQEKTLTEKLTRLSYPAFDVISGEDTILMLYIQDHLICGALYALSMPDEQLNALIDETVGGTV